MRMAQLSHPFLEKVPKIWLNVPFLIRELKVLGSVPQGAKRLRLSLHKGLGTWGPAAWRAAGSPLDMSMGYLHFLLLFWGVVPAQHRCLDVTGDIHRPSLDSGAWHLEVLRLAFR